VTGVLGAMQSLALRDTQENGEGGGGAPNSSSRSVLPPNALRENRAQVKPGNGYSSSDLEFRGGKHTITIGLSLSRRHSTLGHPDTVTRQTAFDFNELQDREYKYVSSTDSSGWRAGGGERGGAQILGQSNQGAGNGLSESPSIGYSASEDGEGSILEQHNSEFHNNTSSGPPGNGPAPLNNGLPGANSFNNSSGAHKVAAPDTVHIPLIHIDAESPAAVDQIISALARGEIFIPHMTILPEALSVNGISPPDLVVRFGCERNDDIPPDEWPNWCLEFMHNQLYEYFASSGARWMKRPFQITLARKVRWKTVKHMNKFFAHSERVINAWREKGPQYLDPQLSYIEGGATPEEVARPHGIYLLRNGRPTNYFPPNFEPPYTTKMTRSLLLNVIGKSWDKKRRDWTSEPVPRLVTPSMLLSSMFGCSDPSQGGFVAIEATDRSMPLSIGNDNAVNGNSSVGSSHHKRERGPITPDRKGARSRNRGQDVSERSRSGQSSISTLTKQSPHRQHHHQQQQQQQQQQRLDADHMVQRTYSNGSAGEDFSAVSAATETSDLSGMQRGQAGVPLKSKMSPRKQASPRGNPNYSRPGNQNVMQSYEDLDPSHPQHEYSGGAQGPSQDQKQQYNRPASPTDSETEPSDTGALSQNPPYAQTVSLPQRISTDDQPAHSPGIQERGSKPATPKKKKREKKKSRSEKSGSKKISVDTDTELTGDDQATHEINDHSTEPHDLGDSGHTQPSEAYSDATNSQIGQSSDANHSQSSKVSDSVVDVDKFDGLHKMFKGNANNRNGDDVDLSAAQSVGESHTTVPIMNSSPAKFIERERERRKEREKEREQERKKMEALEKALHDQMNKIKPKNEKGAEEKKAKTKKEKKEKKEKKKKDKERDKNKVLNLVEEERGGSFDDFNPRSPHESVTNKREKGGISDSALSISPVATTNYPVIQNQPSMEYSVDTASLAGYNFATDGSVVTVGTAGTANQSLLSYVTRTTVGDESDMAGYSRHQQKQKAKLSQPPDDDDISLSILQSEGSMEAIPTDEELFAVGWAKALDPNSGSYYYFTLDRSKTVWESPITSG